MTDTPAAELIAVYLEGIAAGMNKGEHGFFDKAGNHHLVNRQVVLPQAAAALRALSAENERLRREREWRPLGQMPKQGRCWAIIPHGSVDIECLVQWMPPNKAFPQGQWRDTAHESCVAWPSGQARPAYGMPLPPPPATDVPGGFATPEQMAELFESLGSKDGMKDVRAIDAIAARGQMHVVPPPATEAGS